jgi:amphi-Trp domain-containing protein
MVPALARASSGGPFKPRRDHPAKVMWLGCLCRTVAFARPARSRDVELPFGPGTVSLHVPDRVRAEFEVEVEGDEIELEVEFKWSTAQPAAVPIQEAGTAPSVPSRHGNGARGTTKSSRAPSR